MTVWKELGQLVDSKIEESQTKNSGNTSEETTEEVANTESKIVTTEEELDAYRIVKEGS